MASVFSLNLISASPLGKASISIPAQAEIIIGREVGDHTFPSDLQMSTTHFSIRSDGRSCVVTDKGSTNGTFVNGERIDTCTVRDGDEIRAGQTQWELVEAYVPDAPSASRYAPAPTPPPPPMQDDRRAAPSYASMISPPSEEARLILRTFDDEQRVVTASSRLTVGRTTQSTWAFEQDSSMSGRHFEIYYDAGAWMFCDLNSLNGSFVNQGRVSLVKLHDGDVIDAGQTRFEVSIPATPQHATGAMDARRDSIEKLQPTVESKPFDYADAVVKSGPVTAFGATPSNTSEWERTPLVAGSEMERVARTADQSMRNARPALALLIETPDGQRTFRILQAGEEIFIGRAVDRGLSLPTDSLISGRHARLAFRQGAVELADLHSTNGTYVNGQRRTAVQLQNRDEVLIGKTRIQVWIDQKASVSQPTLTDVDAYVSQSRHESPIITPALPTSDTMEVASEPKPSDPLDHRSTFLPDYAASVESAETQPAVGLERSQHASPVDSDAAVHIPVRSALDAGLSLDDYDRGEVDRNEAATQNRTGGEADYPSYPTAEPRELSARNPELSQNGWIDVSIDSAQWEPDTIAMQMLESVTGWLIDMEWIYAAWQANDESWSQRREEWMIPAARTEVAWMVALLDQWGRGSRWMIYANDVDAVGNMLAEWLRDADRSLSARLWMDALLERLREPSQRTNATIRAILRDDEGRIRMIGDETLFSRFR